MNAYLEPFIRLTEKQRPQVERLVQYCYDLDGTKLTVIEGPQPDLPYPKCNDQAFHEVAAIAAGRKNLKGWVWMEADSIPTRAGWLRDLTDEYRKIGTPFLMPDMSAAQKQDIAAGVGIYPPEATWLIPKSFEHNAWDRWLVDHMEKVTGRTKLLQHSYGIYHGIHAQPHRFPRDNRWINPETLLFHRDLYQDIITMSGHSPLPNIPTVEPLKEPTLMRHGGDLGDIIAALPILRAKGGGRIILFHDPNAPVGLRGRESLEGKRYEAIKPLLEAQPYVESVEWGEGVDTQNFRTVMRPNHETLTERQARHVGLWPIDLTPWLTPTSSEKHGRIIAARSGRYPNPYGFPWREVAAAYKDLLLFVGLPAEHAAFEKLVGRPVECAKTENLLDVANLIAGANMSYVNQSCPLWIGLGLGARVIVEGNPTVPNSEIHTNPRSVFCYTAEDNNRVRRALQKLA